MSAILKDDEFCVRGLCDLVDQRPEILKGAKFVLVAVNEQDRLSQSEQKIVITVLVDRRPDRNEAFDLRVVKPDLQSGPRTERKARKRQVFARILLFNVLEHVADIFAAAFDLIVDAR